MPRYKLTIEYAGTRYSGWQVQRNARTVQGELESGQTVDLVITRWSAGETPGTAGA